MVDRDLENIKYEKDMGIALPWNGKKKDTKLLELLSHLHNYILQDAPLRKIFPLIKQNMMAKK